MVTCCDYIYIYIYIFFLRGYLHQERHGTAIFGAARASQGQGSSAMFSFFVFYVLFLFHGRLGTRIKMIHNFDHHRSPY